MSEFEDKVRAAFDAEIKRVPSRPGLRQRVIANAVATPRTRGARFGAWLTPPRLALVGAAAAVLVVAGVGIRLATVNSPGIAKVSPTPSAAQLAFGKLPAPALHPPQGLGGGGGTTASVVPYFGPATMTWSGQLPSVPRSAPVYRFQFPTDTDADAFAAKLGGTLTASESGQGPRTYRLPGGWTLSISFNDPVAGEPTFIMNAGTGPSGTQPLGEAAARAAADAELARRGLTPTWKFTVSVSTLPALVNGAPSYIVRYQRVIDVAPGVTAGEVDGNGDPSGIQVVVDSSGQALQIGGSLRLAEQSATYPLRPPSSVVSEALAAPPLQPQEGPVPAVTLTKVTLVYTVVHSDNVGYLEPAYLFTGTFTMKGPLEKRVLVPALARNSLAS